MVVSFAVQVGDNRTIAIKIFFKRRCSAARFRDPAREARRSQQNLRADAGSAVREVAAFQSESLHCRLRKPAPRLDLLVRCHHCADNGLSRLRILFGDEVDRADGRTALQWFSCHQYDLTVCHISTYHPRMPFPSSRRGTPEPQRTWKNRSAWFWETGEQRSGRELDVSCASQPKIKRAVRAAKAGFYAR